MRRFTCKRCGRCCALAVPVSERDLVRWAVEYRNDILRWVSPGDRFIHGENGHCPFLALLRGIYSCRIYHTRPLACEEFPLSEQQAVRIFCAGWRSETGLAQSEELA